MSNAPFLGVVDSDTPLLLNPIAFLRNGSWLWCQMTVGIVRSQIIAFDISHRLPSHAAKFVRHVQATATKATPRTACARNMVGGCIRREGHSFRAQRVFVPTFSTSANFSMIKMIFFRNFSSLAAVFLQTSLGWYDLSHGSLHSILFGFYT